MPDDNRSTQSDNEKSQSNSSQVDFAKLRETSRQSYLIRREQQKLEDLERAILDEEAAFAGETLTNKEIEELNKKKELLRIAKQKNALSQEESFFQIPDGSSDLAGVTSEEKQNRILHKKHKEAYSGDFDWENKRIKQSVVSFGSKKDAEESSQHYELLIAPEETEDLKEYVHEFEDRLAPEENQLSFPITAVSEAASIQQVKQTLPMFELRNEFLEAISQNQVLILIGETGSGKTTQIPQYLYEAGYAKPLNVTDGNKSGSSASLYRKIGCTQPRRVAAMSVARRVAEEMNCRVGDKVGYSIRFEDCTSPQTIIKYMTDGMLLREFMSEPDLASYSCLIIDEAHERTLHTDILFGLVKDIAKFRPDLKVIISSATLDAEKFSSFFDDAPIFYVPGRRFPVDIFYTKAPEADYLSAAMSTIFQIHLSQPIGDILVFLTGQDEIESLQEQINAQAKSMDIPELIVLPIHSTLPPEMQSEIFKPTPEGSRKVVLATNIAETSITIDGIAFVIDPGFVKIKQYHFHTGLESLTVQPCSKASANQRSGRAGRVGPGKCFRLYTKWSYENELAADTPPEILRCNLGNVVLLLKSLGIDDLLNFDFMDPPPAESLIKALNLLYAMGALNDAGKLTAGGMQMSEFPTDPMISKMIVASASLGCLEEIVSIASMLQIQNALFYYPKHRKGEAEKARKSFFRPSGDHFALLAVWEQWVQTNFSIQWCNDNFIQITSMRKAREIRSQLLALVKKIGLDVVPASSSDVYDETAIAKAITSGFFFNTARLSKMGDHYRLAKNPNNVAYIHPSSCYFGLEGEKPPIWIVYYELILTSKEYLRQVMQIKPEWLSQVAPHYFSSKEIAALNGGAAAIPSGQHKKHLNSGKKC